MKRYTIEVTELERDIIRQFRRQTIRRESILKLLDIEEDQRQQQKKPTPDYLQLYRQ